MVREFAACLISTETGLPLILEMIAYAKLVRYCSHCKCRHAMKMNSGLSRLVRHLYAWLRSRAYGRAERYPPSLPPQPCRPVVAEGKLDTPSPSTASFTPAMAARMARITALGWRQYCMRCDERYDIDNLLYCLHCGGAYCGRCACSRPQQARLAGGDSDAICGCGALLKSYDQWDRELHANAPPNPRRPRRCRH